MMTEVSGGLVKMVTDCLSECIQVPQPESPPTRAHTTNAPCHTLQFFIFHSIFIAGCGKLSLDIKHAWNLTERYRCHNIRRMLKKAVSKAAASGEAKAYAAVR